MKGMIGLSISMENGGQEQLRSHTYRGCSKEVLLDGIKKLRLELNRFEKELDDGAPAPEVEPEEQPETTQPAPEEKKHRPAYKTLYRLHCNTCNSTYLKGILNTQTETECQCGASIDLSDAADFEYTCPACKEVWFGKATTYEPNFTMVCGKCRTKSVLRWDKSKRMYVGG